MNSQPSSTALSGGAIFVLLSRLVLGGMFVWMGFSKLRDPVAFLKLIHEYNMVPDGAWWLLNLMAVTLPWMEVFLGLLLIFGIALRGTALVILGLMLMFTAAVTMRALSIYNAGDIAFCAIKFDCGCGTGEEYICKKLPVNLGLTLLSLIVLISRTPRLALFPRLFGRRSAPLAA